MNDFVNDMVSKVVPLLSTTTQTQFHAAKKGKKCFTTAVLSFSKEDTYAKYKRKIQSEDYGDVLRSLNIPVTHEQALHDRDNHVLQFEFVDSKQEIKYHMNHYYIGGGLFWTIFSIYHPDGKVEGPALPDSNFMLGALLLPRLVFDGLLVESVPHREIQSQNKVYTATYKATIPKNKRFVSIHAIVQELFYSLELNTPLKIAMTAAMNDISNVQNNVGAIFLDIDQMDTPKLIQEKCEERKYQVYGSNVANLIDFGMASNVDMRRQVHCVLTMLYSKVPHDDFDIHLIPSSPVEENVYCFMKSFIDGDKVKINVTYMTCLLDFRPTYAMTRIQ